MRPTLWLLSALLVLQPHAGALAAQQPPSDRSPLPALTDSTPEAARAAGETAALSLSRSGWFGRGFLGGVLAGPIGGAVAFSRAGRVPALPPAAARQLEGRDPAYVHGFTDAFRQRLREERREAALVGGILGTGVFVAALLYLTDFHLDGGERRGPLPPDDPGKILLPLRP